MEDEITRFSSNGLQFVDTSLIEFLKPCDIHCNGRIEIETEIEIEIEIEAEIEILRYSDIARRVKNILDY
jgi:hypothetical protein